MGSEELPLVSLCFAGVLMGIGAAGSVAAQSASAPDAPSPAAAPTRNSSEQGVAPGEIASRGDAISTALRLVSTSCGDAAAIETQVVRRSSKVVFTSEAAEAEVRVVIEGPPAAQTYHAEIEVSRAGSQLASRSFYADTCGELLTAVGFVIALALDPPSANEPPVEQAPEPRRDAPTSGDPVRFEDAPESAGAPPAQTSVQLGLGPQFVSGPAASPMLGLAGFVAITWDAEAPSVIVAPSVRLELGHAQSSDSAEAGGVASFALSLAGLSVCPFGVAVGIAVLRPCASVAAGQLAARGDSTLDPATRYRPWVMAGGSLVAELQLSSRWQLGAGAQLATPFVRDEFQFEPVVFHRVPPVIAQGSVSAVVVF